MWVPTWGGEGSIMSIGSLGLNLDVELDSYNGASIRELGLALSSSTNEANPICLECPLQGMAAYFSGTQGPAWQKLHQY